MPGSDGRNTLVASADTAVATTSVTMCGGRERSRKPDMGGQALRPARPPPASRGALTARSSQPVWPHGGARALGRRLAASELALAVERVEARQDDGAGAGDHG